jgi:hypothetical protein
MLLSDKKILVSGCGITFSRQQSKTWTNILQFAGCDIVDVGGPAVSNQWIVNKVFLGLQQYPDIKTAVIQLTSLKKLDVEVGPERINDLVKSDPLRNFIIDEKFQVTSADQINGSGIWPSSASDHHESKKQWYTWLCSPGLEKEDLYCKLLLLDAYCQQNYITLQVYQGYDIDWTAQQSMGLQNTIKNQALAWYSAYLKSPHYQNHNHEHQNTVPCIGYQIEIAQMVAKELPQHTQDKIAKFKLAYDRT